MIRFYVVQCPKCVRYSVSLTKKSLRNAHFECKYCHAFHVAIHKDKPGLQLKFKGPYESGKHAAVVCQILNQERGLNYEKIREKTKTARCTLRSPESICEFSEVQPRTGRESTT